MSEDQLQFNIVTKFHNKYPSERGYLYRTENKTNKGASKKGLGLIEGVSDLHYTSPCKTKILFELKAQNSRHEIDRIEKQINWMELQRKRGAVPFFIFSEQQFDYAIESMIIEGVTHFTHELAIESFNVVEQQVMAAKLLGRKTVELSYIF